MKEYLRFLVCGAISLGISWTVVGIYFALMGKGDPAALQGGLAKAIAILGGVIVLGGIPIIFDRELQNG